MKVLSVYKLQMIGIIHFFQIAIFLRWVRLNWVLRHILQGGATPDPILDLKRILIRIPVDLAVIMIDFRTCQG